MLMRHLCHVSISRSWLYDAPDECDTLNLDGKGNVRTIHSIQKGCKALDEDLLLSFVVRERGHEEQLLPVEVGAV